MHCSSVALLNEESNLNKLRIAARTAASSSNLLLMEIMGPVTFDPTSPDKMSAIFFSSDSSCGMMEGSILSETMVNSSMTPHNESRAVVIPFKHCLKKESSETHSSVAPCNAEQIFAVKFEISTVKQATLQVCL